MINPMDLTGRHVVVTGASSGIGAEVCRQCARLGARVSLVARSEGRLRDVRSSLEGDGHGVYTVDLADPGSVEPVMRQIREEQGPFDGAVYSAGLGDCRSLRMTKPDKLLEMAKVNYLSYVEFARCVSLKNMHGERLSIVGISSAASERGEKSKTMYCSTKAAMDGAMRAMAHELAHDGTRVNDVLPGWVRTPMYDRYVEALGDENISKEFELLQYMGVPVETVDVANAVAFLLSDASRFITGIQLVVGGGCLS